MSDILRRTTIIVRDAEMSARFYEHVFGWTRWLDTPFTLSGRQLAAGKAGDRTRLILMKAEDDFIGMPRPVAMDRPADGCTAATRACYLWRADLRRECRRLRRDG